MRHLIHHTCVRRPGLPNAGRLPKERLRIQSVYVRREDTRGRRKFISIGAMCLNCHDFTPRQDLYDDPGPLWPVAEAWEEESDSAGEHTTGS